MAAELRKSPRPDSLVDPSRLGTPPQPPPSSTNANGSPNVATNSAAPATSARPVWGVRPSAEKAGGAPLRAVLSSPIASQSSPSLSSSNPSITAPADGRKESGSAPPSSLSISQPATRQARPGGHKYPGVLEDKFMRSPSAPVLEPPARQQSSAATEEVAGRARQTLPLNLAGPPRPVSGVPDAQSAPQTPQPTPPSSPLPPSSPTSSSRTSSNSPASTAALSSASSPNLLRLSGQSSSTASPTLDRLSSGSQRQFELPGDTPDTEQNIIYDEKRCVRAANVAKIFEKLSNPAFDSSFTFECIVTYPLFCTASEFLEGLVLRYQTLQNASCRRKIVHDVIRSWIELNFDWSVETNLRAFLQSIRQSKNSDAVLIPELFDHLDRYTRRMREGYNSFSCVPPDTKMLKPLMPKDLSKVHTIEDIHPKEMARQITLLASDIYKKIRVAELLKQAWSKKDKEKNAPNVLHLINRFNKTSLWVASMCVLPETVPARASTISYFIKVAKEMKEIRNFDGMIAILNGLENSSVLRLKQSWAFVEGKQDLQLVKDMMTFDGNYKAYREHLANLDGSEPVVPFIAPFLGDLTFIDENPNQINGLVNLGKCRLIAKSIQTALKFQKADYPFEPVPMVQKYLAKIKLPEEADIYEVSVKREKKGEEDKAASIMVDTLFS